MHHIIVSAFCGPKKANVHVTLPKYTKMVDMWLLFYAILAAIGLTFWQTPYINWTEDFTFVSVTNTTAVEE